MALGTFVEPQRDATGHYIDPRITAVAQQAQAVTRPAAGTVLAGARPRPVSGGRTNAVNRTGRDPDQQRLLDEIAKRRTALEAGEHKPNTVDIDRIVNRSTLDIADRAAGAQQATKESLAARGIGTSGAAGAASVGITEAAQRDAARSEAGIRIEGQKMQDAADLQREGNLTGFIAGTQGAYQAPGQLRLGQQSLGIQQQQAGLQRDVAQASLDDRARDRELQKYLADRAAAMSFF